MPTCCERSKPRKLKDWIWPRRSSPAGDVATASALARRLLAVQTDTIAVGGRQRARQLHPGPRGQP